MSKIKAQLEQQIPALSATNVDEAVTALRSFASSIDKAYCLDPFKAMRLADENPALDSEITDIHRAASRHLFKCIETAEARRVVADAATEALDGRDSMLVELIELERVADMHRGPIGDYLNGVICARTSLAAAGVAMH